MSTVTASIIGRVQLGGALAAVARYIRKYVVLSDEQAIAVVLWAAHTHALDAADCTPYLQITSATKQAGKTRLLETLEPIIARPWLTGRVSAAALVRKVDAEAPSLLLDESDAAFKGEKEYAEALRGILNTGYRRSGKATLCVGQGANLTFRDFSTFSPKAIAGIGTLPDTVADRSITVTLRRRTTDEPCARWCERDGHAEGALLHQQLATWAPSAIGVLRAARPNLPSGLSDRKADVWEPLLAIADLAGGDWPSRAQSAALTLAGAVKDSDILVELLRDLSSAVLPFYPVDGLIPTKDILEKLSALEDRPWATWSRGKPMTGRALALKVEDLRIYPASNGDVRGYRADAFTDAIARYLPFEASTRNDANNNGPKVAKTTCQPLLPADGSKNPVQAGIHWAGDALTDETPVIGELGDERF